MACGLTDVITYSSVYLLSIEISRAKWWNLHQNTNVKYENFIAFCRDTLYIKTTCNKVTTDNTQQYIELN